MFTTAVVGVMFAAGLAGPCSSSSHTGAAVHAASWEAKKDIVDTAVSAGTFKTLAAALGAADLIDALRGDGPFTVFAPTDDAFAKLPAGTVESLLEPENKSKLQQILLYHVVPGEADAAHVVAQDQWTTLNGQRVTIADKSDRVLIDNAKIIQTDIEASNGLIHVIDTVIMPETRTIPEVADAAGSFGTLLTAVKAAGLKETLMGEGPFTVFAPTDEAFAALGSTVQDLLRPENREQLASILTYHVVAGRVYSDQAKKLRKAETVNGKSVSIRASRSALRVGDATVVQADIQAGNGVIHVIDSVLIPE